MDLRDKSISLIGYGVSNRALCEYFLSKGLFPIIRSSTKLSVPSGAKLICENYLNASEDVVFRSPSLRPDKIITSGVITSEAEYALSLTNGVKIGITGSDGKTTTSTLIYEMLRAQGKEAVLCGNIGAPIIDFVNQSTNNTFSVCELSSFQLFDMEPQLDVAVITNISENHLDWHTDMSEYVSSKKRILKNAKLAVLSCDNPYTRLMSELAGNKVIISKTDLSHARMSANHTVYIKNGAIWCDEEELLKIEQIKIKGAFNVENAQYAIGALLDYVDADAMRKTLREFEGAQGRMQRVRSLLGVDFVCSSIDTTPTRTIATLSAFDKSKCIIILGGYDKGVSYAPLAEALRGVKHAIILGANGDKIENEIKDSCNFSRVSTLEDAVKTACELAREKDTVLLSPASASFDMFKDYKERENKFKQIVRGLK